MYDLVVVGGGIAGLCAALGAPVGSRIAVIDKGEAGAGSSPLAQGGIAAAVGDEDSPEFHAADTILAGVGICDEDVVRDICAEGPAAIDWLIEMGCSFDRAPDGSIHLAREGGQSVGRSVHWRDATGAEIVRALRQAVHGRTVERIRARADALIIRDRRCIGVIADGIEFHADATLLASGGAGGLWGHTTNASGATGDGIALALEAGAQVADLEFMQFHPTALDDGNAQRVLLTEALRGDGAILVDAKGERFVEELGPRHLVAKAIIDHAPAFLDCRPIDDLVRRFPTVVAGARARGFDPLTQPLPVSPAAHYYVGGVAADSNGRTSVEALFAAGECASTGMHGANRMAGNSLLETVVVGRRVGAQVHPGARSTEVPVAAEGRGEVPVEPALARIMWSQVGPIRNAAGLARALDELAALPPGPHRELCAMIVRAALARAESRGVHIRSDFPDADPAYASRSFDRGARRVAH